MKPNHPSVKEIALDTLSRMSYDLEAYGYVDSKSYVGEYTQSLKALVTEMVNEIIGKDITFEDKTIDHMPSNIRNNEKARIRQRAKAEIERRFGDE